MTDTAPEPPYAFFHPTVVRVRHLSPSLVRIVLGDPSLTRVVSGGHDQRLKLFLPRPGQDNTPVLPEPLDTDWYSRWRAMDPAVRAVMRTYTLRGLRADPPELDLDIALHGDLGPASAWAHRARPGDKVSVLAPVRTDNGGVDFRPPPGTDLVVLTGDETALPAVAGILAALPADLPVRAFLEVAHPDDRLPLPTEADAELHWLIRPPHGTDRTGRPLSALAAADLTAGAPYAWLAGEAAAVRAQRRHLLGDRGFRRPAVTFTGYWRQGTTEDQLLAEAARAARA
ncbi:siderophore-interacting protein [Actinacidiphila acididurans]|uniref:Siderophore-interacting protein n=1 Tax=Actinacidiphila acididurans TaxID=2784346 RepID=A0ABS2TRT6_9ACTN|nr:siderophore-interacting protein [Actinacidiphila acididurans]MBM9506053.1 siderophore-interacting protein [Actinacidiphila acididurans]